MEGNYVSKNTHREDHSFGFEEHTRGTSWPARNYGCSFCKREFRSAQALGGHMNVHRRDRARLRSSLCSWVSECPKPNPNTTKPNNSSSPLSDELLNCTHRSPLYSPYLTLPSSASGDKKPRLASSSQQLSPLSPQSMEIKMMSKNTTVSAFDIEDLKGCEEEDECRISKNCNEHNLTLELRIGLLKQEEKLDLELRLGH
ncbi:hypothetical protein Lal_00047316 [Lupinus albus]|uniref:Putative transcription factor C2H2 family n=1 Tax=Lupinus albus TaxID=3870 RepID=A0A6A5N8N5_LUPAL|nr:putative transcription factor C2H2 family [Lupinus albus]KAF1878645.1 hypothetical protein Lal_00047316 [Lupinus albus]